MTKTMICVTSEMDIPEEYRDTPIERLLLHHNPGLRPDRCEGADMLILMCMDNRQDINLPRNSAFFVRNSGGTQNGVSFSLSFAIAIGGIRYIAVIGHSDCMMVNLETRKKDFVENLSEHCLWDRAEAERHFMDMCAQFSKTDAIDSVIAEVEFIRSQYPGVIAAPLFYSVEDHMLYLIGKDSYL